MRRVLPIVLALVLTTPIGRAPVALADPGDVDRAFGTDGVATAFPAGAIAYGAALDPDGRVVVAGSTFDDRGIDVAVARFRRDGTLDPTFGGNGRVRLDLGGQDFALDVAVRADGRIVVVGRRSTPSRERAFALMLRPNGRRDATFGGGDGLAVVDLGARFQGANAVALTRRDRIVLAGWASSGANDRTAVARLRRDGRPDRTFSGDGRAVFDLAAGDEQAADVLVRRDGSVVVAGHGDDGRGTRFLIAQLTAEGRLDRGFGRRGRNLTDVARGADVAEALAEGSDRSLVVAGASADGGRHSWAVVRYGPRGRLDPTFGDDGRVVLRFTDRVERASDALVLGSGRIVLAGRIGSQGRGDDIGVVRLRPTGERDRSFGRRGVARVDVFAGTDAGRALLRSPSGRLVVAGEGWRHTTPRMAVVRLLG